MLVISLFDYTVILKFYWLMFAVNLALLWLVRTIGAEAVALRGG